jgi:hypothetical protein
MKYHQLFTLNDGQMTKAEANHFPEYLKIKKCQCCKDSLRVSNRKILREFLLHSEPAYDTVHIQVRIVSCEYKTLHRLIKILQFLGSDNVKCLDNVE